MSVASTTTSAATDGDAALISAVRSRTPAGPSGLSSTELGLERLQSPVSTPPTSKVHSRAVRQRARHRQLC